MTVKSISEILKHTVSLRGRQAKVDYLKKNASLPLKNVLILMYDRSKKFLVPNTKPPYKPSEAEDNHGALYRESRNLKYIVEGYSPPNMNQAKRESIFINMLETVHRDDAELLIDMLQKKRIKGLTTTVINDVFGNVIPND